MRRALSAHPGRVAAEIPPMPGGMTVPLLSGWELLLTGLVGLVVVGVAVVLAVTHRAGAGERSEWQAYLDGRRRRGEDDLG